MNRNMEGSIERSSGQVLGRSTFKERYAGILAHLVNIQFNRNRILIIYLFSAREEKGSSVVSCFDGPLGRMLLYHGTGRN